MTLLAQAFEQFMEMTGRTYSQGGACYGNHLFVGIGGNKEMDVYDLEKKELVGVMKVNGADPVSHANTLNFGPQFYAKNDEFPVLYVSTGERTTNVPRATAEYVYRIEHKTNRDGSQSYTANLVQTIILVGFSGWVECVVDCENAHLWVATSYNKKRVFMKYQLPDVHQAKVMLNVADALETIEVDDIPVLVHQQGYLCRDGHIYFPTGMPGEVHYWVSVNLETKAYDYIVNLFEVEGFDKHTHLGNAWEPEYLFYYQGDCYMGFRHFIYKMDLELVKQANYFYHRYMITH